MSEAIARTPGFQPGHARLILGLKLDTPCVNAINGRGVTGRLPDGLFSILLAGAQPPGVVLLVNELVSPLAMAMT